MDKKFINILSIICIISILTIPVQAKYYGDFILPSNPSEYITLNNPIVKETASKLYIDYDGRIRYKNISVPSLVDSKGNILLTTDKPFLNNYSFDIYKNIYGYVDKNNVPWITPYQYLNHNQTGVCSAYSVTIVSMMLSGNMSIKEGNNFTQQIIPAKVVIGYRGGNRDAWVEYKVYNKTFVTYTGMITTDLFGNKISYTYFTEKTEDTYGKPIYEFNNNLFSLYEIINKNK